jgi:3',5'-cyclic AMP phosphodiesterase CpdA
MSGSFITKTLLVFPLLIASFTINASDTVSFIQITDTHFCNLSSYHPAFVQKRQHFGDGAEPLVNFLDSLPRELKAGFTVITGDMIDYYEAGTNAGGLLDTQVEQFVRLLDETDVPVYMSLGNHDIASYPVISESKFIHHQNNSEQARSAWIRNASCFRDGTYYSRTVNVGETSYRLIFLDNAWYLPGRTQDDPPYVIDPYQLHWLDDQIKQSDSDIELIFMHMPLYGGAGVAADEKGQVIDTETLNMECTLADVLKDNSSVKMIFSGHKHRNVIYKYRMSDDYSVNYVETGAFGYDNNNWRLVRLTENSIIISLPGETGQEFILRH